MNLTSDQFGGDFGRVGAELRAARERLGWDLSTVAGALRIRASVLDALEQDRAADMPAMAYAVGFVRSYANMLGLPAEIMCRRFREEHPDTSRHPELVFPTPIREHNMPFGAAALLAVTIAVVGYGGWYHYSGNRPGQIASVPPVPERLAPLAEPAQPAVASATPAPGPAAAAPADQSADAGNVAPSEAAATVVANPTPNYEQAAGTPATSRVMLHANADSWLQVHDGSGNLLFSRILKAGESWQVPSNAGTLYLTTGNAGGTDVLVDGQPTSSLGGFGVVRHDLSLDPDQVKAGKLGADTATVSTAPG